MSPPSFAIRDFATSENAMIELCRKYPYWGKGHGALYDLNRFLKRLDKAEYHLQQLIALQPRYDNLLSMGELLGMQGRFDDSRAVLEHLRSQDVLDGVFHHCQLRLALQRSSLSIPVHI